MSLVTDCVTLPPHVVAACNQYRKGGISAVAIINTDASIADFTSPSQWQAAIDAGKVKVIKNIKAMVPEASAVEGENALACGAEKITDGFDGTISWKDFNVNADNDLFYAELNLKRCYLALYFCQQQEIRVITPAGLVTFSIPPATVPEGNREKQVYNGKAMWFFGVGEYSTLSNAPVGIFT